MWSLGADGTDIAVKLGGKTISYRVGAPGAHLAQNSLAVVAALDALGANVGQAVPAMAHMSAAKGRGARSEVALKSGHILLIDESYNANPASMRSALAALATVPRVRFPRRIAVLGDMLELGKDSGSLHAALNEPVDAAEVDLVFACGPNMQRLYEALPAERRGAWAPTSQEIVAALIGAVRPGDVVMVKGSLGTRMAPLVEALLNQGQQPAPATATRS
jgi:UDP-N-acetylmuramoyl-tripeptide--D-alanyl-D-alanine ligase